MTAHTSVDPVTERLTAALEKAEQAKQRARQNPRARAKLEKAERDALEDKRDESGPPADVPLARADVLDKPDEPPRATTGDQAPGKPGEPDKPPRSTSGDPPPAAPVPAPTGPRKRARLIRASEVQARAIQWLWADWIPFGMLTLLDGDPGLGKSTLTLDLVARVTRGDVMPNGGPWCNGGKPANAIVLMLEDAIAETIRPRLDAAGADCARVLVMTGIRDDDTDPDTERPPALPVDLGALREAIVEHEARIVIIDPLMAYLGGDTDSHKDQDIRRALTPLARIAEETNAAIVIVRHLRKGAGPAIYRGGGSIGIMGSARVALILAKDPSDPNARVLAVSKSNISKDTDKALRWRAAEVEIETANGTAKVARAQWEGVAEGITADMLANTATESKPEEEADPEPGHRDQAATLLRTLLAQGPASANAIEREIKAELGCSRATIRRAATSVGIVKKEIRERGRVTAWEWALPDGSDRRGGTQ